MNTPTLTGISPTGTNYWYDPAVAKNHPDQPDSKWCCSVRGPNGHVIAWAEGDDGAQARARAEAICVALNERPLLEQSVAYWKEETEKAWATKR